MKNIIAAIVLFFLMGIGLYFAINSIKPNYENKGKKALINGRDTCIIQSEENESFFNPTRIKVLYKDNYGKYTEQQFDADLITIIK